RRPTWPCALPGSSTGGGRPAETRRGRPPYVPPRSHLLSLNGVPGRSCSERPVFQGETPVHALTGCVRAFTLFTLMSEQRERILACACELYLTDGLDGFSMRKLARSLGVTAPALYRHYESK